MMPRGIPDWQLPQGVDRGLWDYLHSQSMAQSYDERLAGTPLLQADVAFAEEQFSKPGSLIDFGCGTGRLLIPFARRGFACTGIDLSDEMLGIAAAKADQAGLSISLLKANLVELDAIASAAFDYGACLFSTLGMIRGRDNRRTFLKQVYRILRPGGKFVVHVHNRQFRFGRGLGNKGIERGDRKMPQAYGGAELTLHHYSRREIVRELQQVGFRVRVIKPIGSAGELRCPWFISAFRAYGYLVAAEK